MLLRFLILAFVLMMTTPIFSQTPTIETGVSNTLAKWRGANYSDVRYKLNLTLEKMSPTLKGTIEISLKNNADQIILDWRKIRGKEDLSTVSNVHINGCEARLNYKSVFGSAHSPVKYEETNEHLVFKTCVVKNKPNIIKLDFTSPIATSGAAITRYVDKEDGAEYVYSLFVPSDASTAFPVFDQPDLKARFSLEITAPNDWKVVSNANAKEKSDNLPIIILKRRTAIIGKATLPKNHEENSKKVLLTTEFEETKPISTYAFAFATGEFVKVSEPSAVAGGLPQRNLNAVINNDYITPNISNAEQNPPANAGGSDIYVRKSQAEKFKPHAAEVFRLNREAVKFLESYFDYKFPFPKYDLVLIPEFPFGGMEHAGATFLRESSVIFPTDPTKNDFVSRANLIFHEAAHQWFGDTVTMKWFDDLWLKEGFAEFMAYKTLEKVLPEYNAWKIFYERNKQLAYLTDSTRGTTPIYQEIPNLSSAKSAYGNIVYRKAPSFLRQAEFYLGADKFQTAVRAFLKKYQFKNAEWKDLVNEFNKVHDRRGLPEWAEYWVKQKGVPIIRTSITEGHYEKSNPVSPNGTWSSSSWMVPALGLTLSAPFEDSPWAINIKTLYRYGQESEITENMVSGNPYTDYLPRLFDKNGNYNRNHLLPDLIFPNYQDYGYGIFLLDEKSRDYVLQNIQNEKDDFLRTMMWGALWDSVRETELAPKDYVELVIKNINVETDESTIQTLLNRVSTAMNYYLSELPALAGGSNVRQNPPANAGGSDFSELENLLIEKMSKAETLGQRITFYRAFLNIASSEKARTILKEILNGKFQIKDLKLKTKDKFDIATRLLIVGDKDAPNLLAELEKVETSDEAKRYAYAAKAGIATAENKAKFYNDFVGNKELSESWIESAFVSFNSSKHAELTLPFLEKALAELPNLKRGRKIFFVNGWLGAFIGGQRSEQALAIVNKFLADNPNLDRDLRLKILENADGLERAVKIRAKFTK